MPVVELLAPQLGERILDLGCGDGALTARLAGLGCEVVGVDSSPEQVAAARKLGLDARVMDAQALDFDEEFDAVFSNAVLHWIPAADAVIAGVRRALRPGGRFVGEFGGEGNIQAIVSALYTALRRRGVDPAPLNPWYYPGVAEYRARLEAHAFRVRTIALIPRPTPQPGDIAGWLETFAKVFLAAVPAEAQPDLMAELREMLRPTLYHPAEGKWVVDYGLVKKQLPVLGSLRSVSGPAAAGYSSSSDRPCAVRD
jgi:SAM-dependent methyltransferase